MISEHEEKIAIIYDVQMARLFMYIQVIIIV